MRIGKEAEFRTQNSGVVVMFVDAFCSLPLALCEIIYVTSNSTSMYCLLRRTLLRLYRY